MTSPDASDDHRLVALGDAYSKLTLTHLSDPSAAPNMLEQGKRAYASKHYRDALDYYNRTVEILQRDLSAALVHRAAAFEMKRNYKSVLQDTLRVNASDVSTVPDPYLIMANTLLLQNRLREAALQLHTGITVVPNNCLQYSTLADLYQRVAAEMNRRNRWMANLLPNEILNSILLLLSVKDCIQLSFTCRHWYNYIMQEWPCMWSTIDTGHDQNDLPLSNKSILQKVLNSIPSDRPRKVTLHHFWPNEEKHVQLLENTLMQKSWNKLEYIGIHYPREETTRGILRRNPNIKELELWGNLLNTDESIQKVSIDAVTMCTNLQSITMHIKFDENATISSQLHPSNLVLTRLSLSFLPHSAKTYNAKTQLKHNTNTLCLINTQCPMLQELILGSYAPYYHATMTYSSTLHIPGLTSLNIRTNGIKDPDSEDINNHVIFQQQTQLLFQRNRNHLQSLTLSFSHLYTIYDCTILLNIASIGLPMLTSLNVSFYSEYPYLTPRDIQDLIATCPALEQVRIYGCLIWDAGVFEKLSKLSYLRRLDIDIDHCTDIVRIIDGDGIRSLTTNSQTLRYFSFGYRCSTSLAHCQNPNIHCDFLVEVIRCVSNSTIQELDITRAPIQHENDIISLVNCVNDSQIRVMAIHIDYDICGDEEVEAIASLRRLSLLKIHNERNDPDKQWLIQIFKKHKGQYGTFTIQINHPRYYVLVGRKQCCEPRENTLEADCVKDEDYYMALYAIACTNRGGEYLVDRPLPPYLYSDDEYYEEYEEYGEDGSSE